MPCKKYDAYSAVILYQGSVVYRVDCLPGITFDGAKSIGIATLKRWIDGAHGRVNYTLSLRGIVQTDIRTEAQIKVGFSPIMTWVDDAEVFSL